MDEHEAVTRSIIGWIERNVGGSVTGGFGDGAAQPDPALCETSGRRLVTTPLRGTDR